MAVRKQVDSSEIQNENKKRVQFNVSYDFKRYFSLQRRYKKDYIYLRLSFAKTSAASMLTGGLHPHSALM